MLDYSRKLTIEPHSMAFDDVEQLRRNGLSDSGILDLNLVVGYYAFVNRLADGLGVELEDWWDE